MNIQNGLNNRKIVKQKIELSNASSPLTRSEIDFIFTIISQIKKEDTEFKDYYFTIKELEVKMERKLNPKQVQDMTLSLFSKPLLLPVDGKLDSKNWIAVNWFKHVQYKEGNISCSFDKRLKPYLIGINNRFSKGSLSVLLPMRSRYSKEVYMLLAYDAFKGFYEVEVEHLMKKLKVPKSMLVYADFKRKVLLQSQKDLDKFSDIIFTFEEIKKGRKVHRLKFNIKRNLNDLTMFIKVIRELYINKPLIKTSDGTLQCSTKGNLYYKEFFEIDIHPKKAKLLWEKLHENRDKLLVFKESQRELVERMDRLNSII
jgi:plasmid replication initiation protein